MMRRLGSLAALVIASVTGSAAACDYTVEKVTYKNLVAKAYLPKSERPTPLVLAFGGSEGGLSTGESSGDMLAPRCIAVLALAYFKEQGLPPTLDHIPLEYFVDAIDYAAQLHGVDKTRLGILSGSRGSEAALLVASLDARIRSVVVATPSEVAWHGRTEARSAWTWQGKDVPALALDGNPSLPQTKRFENALDAVMRRDDYGIRRHRTTKSGRARAWQTASSSGSRRIISSTGSGTTFIRPDMVSARKMPCPSKSPSSNNLPRRCSVIVNPSAAGQSNPAADARHPPT
jgi:hypothetical protein